MDVLIFPFCIWKKYLAINSSSNPFFVKNKEVGNLTGDGQKFYIIHYIGSYGFLNISKREKIILKKLVPDKIFSPANG